MFRDEGGASRRAWLKSVLGLGVSLRVVPVVAGQDEQATSRPREGDLLVRTNDSTQTPLKPEDIPLSATPVIAWPMEPIAKILRSGSRLNRILLMRLPMESLGPETRPRAADGVVAYTAICTHSGCDIGDWLDAEQVLYCACHSTKFDPRDNARVIDGPAPRSLPALPLKLVDGVLVVARPFTTRVGFEEV